MRLKVEASKISFKNADFATIIGWLLVVYGYGIVRFSWSGRRGSNPRPSAWEADALPTELLPHVCSVGNAWKACLLLACTKQLCYHRFVVDEGESDGDAVAFGPRISHLRGEVGVAKAERVARRGNDYNAVHGAVDGYAAYFESVASERVGDCIGGVAIAARPE